MALLELPTIDHEARAPSLVDGLLAEQQRLTAVERFARLHEAGADEGLTHSRVYRDLLPLTVPQDGEQYAFTVDLDACSGCKACVTACHSLNGLDDSETFRDVGALIGRDRGELHVLQHVTTACHHCLEPACLTGCPTLAYDKDPQTGIVRHLDDQCIGCQYCTLMCPYDVPKYNAVRGIVRKCDMCRQRLDGGEAPACVHACPNQAIRIEVVSRAEIRQRSDAGHFLPLAPEPRLTLPTTSFVSKRRPLLDVAAADSGPERPAHAHWPLVVMLVLTQMSVGMFCIAQLLRMLGTEATPLIVVAAMIGFAGQLAAIFHLGRPTIAWKAWLGWRTSWLSREVIAFGAFTGLAAASIVTSLLSAFGALSGEYSVLSTTYEIQGAERTADLSAIASLSTSAACMCGIVAVVCSAMIYVATQREYWSAGRTVPRFLLTALLLGLAGGLVVQALFAGESPSPWCYGALAGLTLIRLWHDSAILRLPVVRDDSLLGRTVELITGPLDAWHVTQLLAAIVGGGILPLLALTIPNWPLCLIIASSVLLLAAEFIQRWLFFAAAAPPRMPGVSHS